jgi:ubiquinone/menaquinone biosynthesis C-methylase UbiE
MLDIARERCPEATFVPGDALALPFRDHIFERVFTANFYGHLDQEERVQFLAEAARVAPELVVCDAVRGSDHEPEELQERTLADGSVWEVYKRFFLPEELAAELGGGEILFSGNWFVVVRA